MTSRGKVVQDEGDVFEERDGSSPSEKLFLMLEACVGSPVPLNPADLAEILSLPKTTVHRMALQLQALGLIRREPSERGFAAAPRLIHLATATLRSAVGQIDRRSILRRLAKMLGESCGVGVRAGFETMFIDDVRTDLALTLHFRAGSHAPLHCTSMGKVFIAAFTRAEWNRYRQRGPLKRYTPNTPTDFEALEAEVQIVRKRGYAVTHEEYILGVTGAAVPVKDLGGKVVAAISVTAPAARQSREDVERMVPALQNASAAMARTLVTAFAR